MQPNASLDVWSHLSPSERNEVTEQIVRILTEELEHERIDQRPADALETPGGGLPETIRSEAGAGEPREPRSINALTERLPVR